MLRLFYAYSQSRIGTCSPVPCSPAIQATCLTDYSKSSQANIPITQGLWLLLLTNIPLHGVEGRVIGPMPTRKLASL